MKFGIPTMFGSTILISVVALLIAMPIALGIAIFLSNYAPARAVKPLGFLVDMLAAVPSDCLRSVGLAGARPSFVRFLHLAALWAGGFFLFTTYDNSPSFTTGRNIFTGGIVLAVMILPIIAATAREVFVQTPSGPDRVRFGTRRDPVGSYPHDRSAIRYVRLHRRLHAGSGPCTG